MASTAVRTLQNFIDGGVSDAAEGETQTVVSAATGEALAEAPVSTQADVDKAVAAAKKAFETYGRTTPQERPLLMLRLPPATEEGAVEIAELEAQNAGKPLQA